MPAPREWFRGFFDETYLATDRPALTPRRTRAEVDFAEHVLELRPGARVLDVPCGFGRHAAELARRGYSAVGVDLSPLMLRVARRDHREGPRLRFVRQDMRRLAYRGEFDAVVCLFTSFGYFGERENVATLRRMARALRPGGRLLMDHRNPAYDVTLPIHSWRRARGGRYVLWTLEIDRRTNVHEATWLILRRGSRRVLRKRFRLRLWTPAQWRRHLREAGLRLLRAYGDFKGSRFRRASPRLLLLAERPRRGARPRASR
ncbi:MAG TPA: class I SAM-dependent methyltransferase [Methylomirabilota bacterium]|nr:class I SAM-dependent methyltransferase [Methylomirabilota bacterium]